MDTELSARTVGLVIAPALLELVPTHAYAATAVVRCATPTRCLGAREGEGLTPATESASATASTRTAAPIGGTALPTWARISRIEPSKRKSSGNVCNLARSRLVSERGSA